jgi:CCR4-NOT transcription complex subunit 9
MDQLFPLVLELTNPEQRESALLELSKKREAFPDLAPILWHSFGTISALLQEIVSIYPLLSPPALTAHASNRVCNALALLQCVASHPETRTLFLNGKAFCTYTGPLMKLNFCSPHPPLPVPFPQHREQESTF